GAATPGAVDRGRCCERRVPQGRSLGDHQAGDRAVPADRDLAPDLRASRQPTLRFRRAPAATHGIPAPRPCARFAPGRGKERGVRQMPRMILLAALLLLGACGKPTSTGLLGYVEADYVYAAPVSGGRIAQVTVKRGDTVSAGSNLFTLDATDETAKLNQAKAALDQAKSKLADLQTGERPEELAIVQAQLDAAKASMTLSVPRVERRRKMGTTKIVGEEEVTRRNRPCSKT